MRTSTGWSVHQVSTFTLHVFATVDSRLFQIGISFTHLLLSCYDVEKNQWTEIADSSVPISGPLALLGAKPTTSCVVINKDIHYVISGNFKHLCLRYSTTNNKWTTLTLVSPPSTGHYHAACVQGNLVLCSKHDDIELRIQVYNSTTNTWVPSPVKLPEGLWIDYACTV